MSYTTYTTDALVCGSFEQNTADKSFLLFTKDAGMLFANARSVRIEASKQRYALQDFSRIRVSLIKGKAGWRIGSVETIKNDFSLAQGREARGSIVALYKLLRRLIRGEEVLAELYDFTLVALDNIVQNQNERSFSDLFIKLQVLSFLGYVDESALPADLKQVKLENINSIKDNNLVIKIEKLVTNALDSSHL